MIDRPIIILGAPRSGTTLLQRCISAHPDVWHLPAESHYILEGPFHPAFKDYESNRVTQKDISPDLARQLHEQFYQDSLNLHRIMGNQTFLLTTRRALLVRVVSRLAVLALGRSSQLRREIDIRFVEKTPKNVLRVPMLEEIFPDARYVFLKRDAETTIDSLIQGWFAFDKVGPITLRKQAGTYRLAAQLDLQDYPYEWWNFALVPGWRDLTGRTVADVAAWQYFQCNRYLLDDLALVDPARVFEVQYEDFVVRAPEILQSIFLWSDLPEWTENNIVQMIRPARKELHNAEAVRKAMQRLPEFDELRKELGY